MHPYTFHRYNKCIKGLILVFFISFYPINLYSIGKSFAHGIQFAFFKLQFTEFGPDILSSYLELILLVTGKFGIRTALGTVTWFIALIFLGLAVFFSIFHNDITDLRVLESSYLSRLSGTLLIASALFILLSDILKFGPLLQGPSGSVIPIGVPAMILFGFVLRNSDDDTQERDKKDLQTRNSRHWKIFYLVTCFSLLFIFFLNIFNALPFGGGDFRDYCSAIDVLERGENPYDPAVIMKYHNYWGSYSYPPAFLPIFKTIFNICCEYQLLRLYFFFYFIIFIIAVILLYHLIPKEAKLFSITFFIIGLNSVHWSFSTGNMSIIYPAILVLIFWLLTEYRYYFASLAISVLSLLNLFPIIFGLIFLSLKKSFSEKIRIIAVAFVPLSLFMLISYFYSPPLYNHYFQKLIGSESQIHEIGGLRTPTSYQFIRDLLLYLGFNDYISLFISFTLFIGFVVIIFISCTKKLREERLILSLAFITIFLLLPRLKPNYFVFILIPLYYLIDWIYRDNLKFISTMLWYSSLPMFILQIGDSVFSSELITVFFAYSQFWISFSLYLLIGWKILALENPSKGQKQDHFT